jgi:DNA-directed RNA polymerase subunit RPC12/RpoP
MNVVKGIRCKDCGKNFYLKDEQEYILSYCDGCKRLVVLYKYNPAILSKNGDNSAVFLSSDQHSKCRKCGSLMSIKNKDDYCSIRCVNCGFGIVYKMQTHRGIGVYIGRDKFNKTIYWTTGKRQADREARDEQNKQR